VTLRRLALVAAAFALLLSACSGTFVPPAAVVDGVRISQDALQARVNQALSNPETAAQVARGGAASRADFTRQLLGSLIVQQIIDRYAERHGLVVTAAEINRELNAEIGRVGREAFDRELRQRGLTVADVRESIRTFLVQNKVRDDITKDLPADTPPEQINQFLNRWLEGQVARADIEVNPRFGKFDPKAVAVCRIVSTAGDTAPDCGQA
jgi:hypothetical protein